MSIQSAMNAAVSGLGAQSRKLASISDNIANSETTGYKRSDVAFSSMVRDATGSTGYLAGGVGANAVREVGKAGSIRQTSSVTDLSIDGSGFFLVKAGLPASHASQPSLLTRAGSSQLDAENYLRLQSGHYLQGFPLRADGTQASQTPQSIRVDGGLSTPRPSTTVSFRANLPLALGGAASEGQPLETTAGYVDGLGSSRPLRFVWTPAPGDVPNSWRLAIHDMAGDPAVPLYDDVIPFAAGGADAGRPTAIPGSADGRRLDLTLADGSTLGIDLQLSQFDADYNPVFSSDGLAASPFAGIEVGSDGTVYSVYRNGSRVPSFRLALGEVANPDGLRAEGADTFGVTSESGALTLRLPGEAAAGTIRAFSLEGSNVDIAAELTQLITTQRVFSANASLITTSDQMLDEVVRLKR